MWAANRLGPHEGVEREPVLARICSPFQEFGRGRESRLRSGMEGKARERKGVRPSEVASVLAEACGRLLLGRSRFRVSRAAPACAVHHHHQPPSARSLSPFAADIYNLKQISQPECAQSNVSTYRAALGALTGMRTRNANTRVWSARHVLRFALSPRNSLPGV